MCEEETPKRHAVSMKLILLLRLTNLGSLKALLRESTEEDWRPFAGEHGHDHWEIAYQISKWKQSHSITTLR